MSDYPFDCVSSVRELLEAADEHAKSWNCQGHVRPWFRGQADAGEPPLPSVLRKKEIDTGEIYEYDEFHLTTMFRLKALTFGDVPDVHRLDQWLFLMQHYGLPTRLLDWTENPLAACFFAASRAVESDKPQDRYQDPEHMGVWMLHPVELNRLTDESLGDFPNTWTQSRCLENFKIAFGTAGRDKIPQPEGGYVIYQPTRYPLAVHPIAC